MPIGNFPFASCPGTPKLRRTFIVRFMWGWKGKYCSSITWAGSSARITCWANFKGARFRRMSSERRGAKATYCAVTKNFGPHLLSSLISTSKFFATFMPVLRFGNSIWDQKAQNTSRLPMVWFRLPGKVTNNSHLTLRPSLQLRRAQVSQSRPQNLSKGLRLCRFGSRSCR